MPESTKHSVNWIEIDISFRQLTAEENAALYAALDMPEDVRAEHHFPDGEPDDLYNRLIAWGWSCSQLRSQRSADLHAEPLDASFYGLGVYGDWTWIEDDERFVAIIAPYVLPGRCIFQVESRPGVFSRTSFPDDADFEAWEFKDGAVTRKVIEKIVEYVDR